MDAGNSNDLVRQVQEMTGLQDVGEVEMLLALSDFDVSIAVSQYFAQLDANNSQQQQQTSLSSDSSSAAAGTDSIIAPSKSAKGMEAWEEQDLRSIPNTINILQKKNGPCGVLTCIIAEVCVLRMDAKRKINEEINDEELQLAVFAILARCRTFQIRFNDKEIHSAKDLDIMSLRNKGACLRIVEAIVQTRTKEQVQKDVDKSNGELPLIIPPHMLCSSELMSLLIRGSANGNFGAVSPLTEKVIPDEDWRGTSYGVLTLPGASGDAHIPQANALMFPRLPIWILHGGDHFTVLAKDDTSKSTFWHFNGLPPAGPSSTTLAIEATVEAQRVTDGRKHFGFVKSLPGEIDEIVQADPEDKKRFKDQWRKWRIEVVLGVDDPSVKQDMAESQSKRDQAKIFKLEHPPKEGETFRCASCYRDRYKTMNFGQQTRTGNSCQFCSNPIDRAGWSLWFRYDQLPEYVQRRVDKMFAPKILNVIRTRWPDAVVTVLSDSTPQLDAPLPST